MSRNSIEFTEAQRKVRKYAGNKYRWHQSVWMELAGEFAQNPRRSMQDIFDWQVKDRYHRRYNKYKYSTNDLTAISHPHILPFSAKNTPTIKTRAASTLQVQSAGFHQSETEQHRKATDNTHSLLARNHDLLNAQSDVLLTISRNMIVYSGRRRSLILLRRGNYLLSKGERKVNMSRGFSQPAITCIDLSEMPY
jgi:hypothetical protein